MFAEDVTTGASDGLHFPFTQQPPPVFPFDFSTTGMVSLCATFEQQSASNSKALDFWCGSATAMDLGVCGKQHFESDPQLSWTVGAGVGSLQH